MSVSSSPLAAAGVDSDLSWRFIQSKEHDAHAVFPIGWDILDRLPRRSVRNDAERRAAAHVVGAITDLCSRFCRENRREIYDRLTDRMTRAVRIDDLAFRAAELWPGLVPTRQQLATESERMQKDKDGREIQQGLFFSQLLSDPEIGGHIIHTMLRPTEAARERLAELVKRGALDLGAARIETRGKVGYVELRHPRFLNAEDDETRGPQELAIDLVLLHPELELGILRGGVVTHAKYSGRRVFSAGINLTRLYHGEISYLFYLLRDFGLVNKIYRGLALDVERRDEPETTHEKPWIAAVEAFAIGGGCQLLLVVDRVLAEKGAYFNLPARKEGIIPGAANLRLPRFVGEGIARDAILFDRTFPVDSPEARSLVQETHDPAGMDAAIERACEKIVGSGVVSAAGNRKAMRVQNEPIETFRRYMATYAREQAFCHLSEQLVENLERHWQAKSRRL